MSNTIPMQQSTAHYRQAIAAQPVEEDDLAPYASLFLKPLTSRKSPFSKLELERMCADPLHSPKLIQYLINFFLLM